MGFTVRFQDSYGHGVASYDIFPYRGAYMNRLACPNIYDHMDKSQGEFRNFGVCKFGFWTSASHLKEPNAHSQLVTNSDQPTLNTRTVLDPTLTRTTK